MVQSFMQEATAHVQTGTTNAKQLAAISEVIAGGVSSSMRAQAIPEPLVVQRAEGDRIWDVEGRELIDLNMGYGPHLFGYAEPELAAALARQLTEGAMTGLPHQVDREAGELIARLVPSVEQVRFANSGTEAIASALRLARAATGRMEVLTFEGHYHGWSETVLRAGKATFHEPAPESTAPQPGAPGMIPEALDHTLQVPWNNLPALRAVFEAHGDQLAAVICEPVMANACVVPPAPGQLEELRALCDRWGAWLIFDEVITGFRVGSGGAQERYGVMPDLTVLSKVMGGGVPVAAFGGSRDTMAMLADHRAMHLGVYAGNHMSVRAVATMLSKIERSPEIYERLEKHGDYLEQQLRAMFAELNRPALVSRVGSLLSVSLLRRPADLSHGPRAAAQAMDFAAHRALQISSPGTGRVFPPEPDRALVPQHGPQRRRPRSRGGRRARRAGQRARVAVSGDGGVTPLELLRETAARSPQAVLFAEEAGNTTAQDLVDLAGTRLEAYRRAGIGPGCRVGAVAWPAASFVADVLAVLALDAVVVPLPRQMSEWERERTEELAAATHLAAPLDWPLLPGAGGVVAGERLIARKPPGEAPPGGAASAQLTSGTSGRTKVALRPVSALMAEAENYRTALDMGPGTVLACPVPLHHAYGFGLAALAAPLAGATTLVTSADRPGMLSRALNEHDVTLVAGVPPLLRLLAEASHRPADAPHRLPVRGHADGPADSRTRRDRARRLARRGVRHDGNRPHLRSAAGPLAGCALAWPAARGGPGRPASPGVAGPQPSADDAADSLSGLVAVRSPTAMTGYLYPDRVDVAPVADGFVTGDIGRMTPDGLVIVGRLANCVNVGGTKVSPEEVEAVLLEFPTVRSCLVDGEPDEWLGQRIRATVTPADVDLSALRAFCRQRLSGPKQPSRFVSVDNLETTATGKVIRGQAVTVSSPS